MLTCVMSLFTSGGRLQVENVSVLRSNFAMPPWNIIPSQRLLSPSKRTDRAPVGKPGFSSGHAVLRDAPRFWIELAQRLLAEVAVPGDAVGSDDDVVGAGSSAAARSYSVMTTRVLRPVGRGRRPELVWPRRGGR